MSISIPPTTVAEVQYLAHVRPLAALTARTSAAEPDCIRQLRPVDRVEPAVLWTDVWVRFPGTWQVRLGWCRLIDSRTTADWAMPPGGAWTQDCSGASREPQARRFLEGGSARGCRGGACPHHARRRCRLRRRGVWVTGCLAHNCEAERRSPILARHDRTTYFTMRSPS